MRALLEWLKPGAKVKRYIFLQLISLGALAYSIIRLMSDEIITPKILLAYIALITISLFCTIYSFILAQRNVLKTTLKNMAYQDRNSDIRKLLYTESMLKKGPKIVMIGGGKGLSNILSGLKEFTSNITSIVSTFDDGGDTGVIMEQVDMLPPGDIRRSIIALSSSEPTMEKLLSFRFKDGKIGNHSVGNIMIAAMNEIMGGFAPAVQKLSEILNVKGKILPVTLDKAKLCAGLENGEIVVGENNIRPRVVESKSRIKQIFLKDTAAEAAPGVLEAIREADAIVLGPGSLYTSVICNLLVTDLGKTIIQSRAKKIMVSNLMNEPGETLGYTLAKHVNEVERYLGKHALDYVIANNGEITEDMLVDFNQGESTPVIADLPNIQNRTISVIEEDLVITAPNSILHDNLRVAELIVEIAKSKKTGNLNLLRRKKKHKKNAAKIEKGSKLENSGKNKATKELAEKMKNIKIPKISQKENKKEKTENK